MFRGITSSTKIVQLKYFIARFLKQRARHSSGMLGAKMRVLSRMLINYNNAY